MLYANKCLTPRNCVKKPEEELINPQITLNENKPEWLRLI